MGQEKFPHGPRKLEMPVAAPRSLEDTIPSSSEDEGKTTQNTSEAVNRTREIPVSLVTFPWQLMNF